MTLSVTSSLASPVDSGVALLDSDADNTSVSEATINETDNLSLRDDREVST
jgi:methyl coenzyme M reductase gamma subunit